MGARKQKKQNKKESGHNGLLKLPARLVSGRAAPLVGVLLAVVFGVSATTLAWRVWGPAALSNINHQLALEKLQVSPQPAWISGDISQQVFRDGSLGQLHFLDQQLTVKVCRAFEMNAWVAHVNRIGKRPSGQVIVDLEYRQPVAWVIIPQDGAAGHEQQKVLPVDAQAVVLDPTELKLQPNELPHISISQLPQYGPKGTVWQDPALLGAAQLAGLLSGLWRECGIIKIRALSHLDADRAGSVYELVTLTGTRIIWGTAPGLERSNEPQAADKLKMLKRRAAGGQLSGRHTLDLRDPKSAVPQRGTARGPTRRPAVR